MIGGGWQFLSGPEMHIQIIKLVSPSETLTLFTDTQLFLCRVIGGFGCVSAMLNSQE
jgi:hypothetical protein